MHRGSTFWRLLQLMSPYAGRMALAAFVGFATIGSSIGLMAAAAYIIASAALHPPLAALQVAIVGVRFFGIARGAFRYLERYVAHQITLQLLAHLRVWFYRAVEPLAPARLLAYRSGDLLSRCVTDVETLEHFYLRVAAPPLVAVLVAALMGVFLATYDVRLAATALAGLALTGIGIPLLTHRLARRPGHQLVAGRADLSAALLDGIQGAADLLAFDCVGRHLTRVATLNAHLVDWQARLVRIAALNEALGGLLVNVTTVAVLAVAIPLVGGGQLSGVHLAVLVLATIASFEAVLPLPLAVQHLESNLAAAHRLFEIIDAAPAVSDPPGASPQPHDYSLVVDNLRFSYPGSKIAVSFGGEVSVPSGYEAPALDGISLRVRSGGCVALVGASGSGKTTLVNLLLRFWEYSSGSIRLGGHELREYRADDVRRLMGVVTQHTHLFNATLRDNLLLARPEADEPELWQALEVAQMAQLVRDLPDGLDTWLGEQGLLLSAGERQRVAIARALLRDTPILILDEATANLDTITELAIWRALDALMAGRTSLIVTHRTAGLERADEVLVLQDGRVVERGCHTDLLQADTLYRRWWGKAY
jgi:ATP-binding cassette subfamily C protein CydC